MLHEGSNVLPLHLPKRNFGLQNYPTGAAQRPWPKAKPFSPSKELQRHWRKSLMRCPGSIGGWRSVGRSRSVSQLEWYQDKRGNKMMDDTPFEEGRDPGFEDP